MKNLYTKSKGKIHPSPAHSSSAPLTVLELLPPSILTIVSILSLSDREVLAYLILRSLQNPISFKPETPTPKCERSIFDCGCFDCYTSFWVRWDSSPNRELIHQAIEAFEDHLTDISTNTHKAKPKNRCVSADGSPHELLRGHLARRGECSKKTQKGKCKTRPVSAEKPKVEHETTGVECSGPSPGVVADEEVVMDGEGEVTGNRQEPVASVEKLAGAGNKWGLVRKIWPDVLGLFNSRLWSLWGPNI